MNGPRMHPGYTLDTPPDTPWIHIGYAPQIHPGYGILNHSGTYTGLVMHISMLSVSMGLWDTPQLYPRYTPGYILDTPWIILYTPLGPSGG